ncbi:MAG: nucleotide-binding protein [Ferruginibacter sp.]
MARKPFLFIGSSSEGKSFAEALQVNLKEVCESQIWDQGLFGLSDGTFETLVKSLDKFDFAVFLLTGDDLIESRGSKSTAPRDNVIFELGLFIGSLGRTRVYMVCDKSVKPKIPSDLAGITIELFEPPERATLMAALGPASTSIKAKIDQHGLRQVVEMAKNNYQNDLELILAYLKDKGLESMSFEKLKKNVNDRFDKDLICKIIEANPSKIRRTTIKGDKPGIKAINLYGIKSTKRTLIWQDNFDNINHWKMNFWGSKNSIKTNRIENGEMIFEATSDEVENENGSYGAYIDLTSKIENEKTYEIRCKICSLANTTMGFQLWIHDGKDGKTKVIEPLFPKTPSIIPEIIKVQFTATESNSMRIHLYCRCGLGMLKVSEVTVYQI